MDPSASFNSPWLVQAQRRDSGSGTPGKQKQKDTHSRENLMQGRGQRGPRRMLRQLPLYQQKEGSACARGCSSGDRPVPVIVSRCPDLMVSLHGHSGCFCNSGRDPGQWLPGGRRGTREDREEPTPTRSCYVPCFVCFLKNLKQ